MTLEVWLCRAPPCMICLGPTPGIPLGIFLHRVFAQPSLVCWFHSCSCTFISPPHGCVLSLLAQTGTQHIKTEV